jgi:hypothetical protein
MQGNLYSCGATHLAKGLLCFGVALPWTQRWISIQCEGVESTARFLRGAC